MLIERLIYCITLAMKSRLNSELNLHFFKLKFLFVFRFYRGHLSSRLINGTPTDLSAERSLVERFKVCSTFKVQLLTNLNCIVFRQRKAGSLRIRWRR